MLSRVLSGSGVRRLPRGGCSGGAAAAVAERSVATDGQFITSRKPDDIPAFSKAIIAFVSQGAGQRAVA